MLSLAFPLGEMNVRRSRFSRVSAFARLHDLWPPVKTAESSWCVRGTGKTPINASTVAKHCISFLMWQTATLPDAFLANFDDPKKA